MIVKCNSSFYGSNSRSRLVNRRLFWQNFGSTFTFITTRRISNCPCFYRPLSAPPGLIVGTEQQTMTVEKVTSHLCYEQQSSSTISISTVILRTRTDLTLSFGMSKHSSSFSACSMHGGQPSFPVGLCGGSFLRSGSIA